MRELRLWAAAAAGPAFAAGFHALAVLRRRRSLHPTGIGYEGWLRVPDEGLARPGVPCSRPARPDRPLLRRLLFPARSFVRGAFSTALPYDLGDDRVVLLLVPARTGHRRSADGHGRRSTRGALPELRAAADGLGFELRTARSFGRSQPLATVTVGRPLPDDQTEALRFNPWTTGSGIRPAGWLNLLRDAAYRASQRGRGREPSRSRPGRPSSPASTGALLSTS